MGFLFFQLASINFTCCEKNVNFYSSDKSVFIRMLCSSLKNLINSYHFNLPVLILILGKWYAIKWKWEENSWREIRQKSRLPHRSKAKQSQTQNSTMKCLVAKCSWWNWEVGKHWEIFRLKNNFYFDAISVTLRARSTSLFFNSPNDIFPESLYTDQPAIRSLFTLLLSIFP